MWNLSSVTDNFRYVVNGAEDALGESYLLSRIIVDMETGQRGFLITGKDEFLEPFEKANEEFDRLLVDLRGDLAGG